MHKRLWVRKTRVQEAINQPERGYGIKESEQSDPDPLINRL